METLARKLCEDVGYTFFYEQHPWCLSTGVCDARVKKIWVSPIEEYFLEAVFHEVGHAVDYNERPPLSKERNIVPDIFNQRQYGGRVCVERIYAEAKAHQWALAYMKENGFWSEKGERQMILWFSSYFDIETAEGKGWVYGNMFLRLDSYDYFKSACEFVGFEDKNVDNLFF